MTTFFVSATGTDIGKTFVTAGLIRHLRGQGKPARAIKPVVSGMADPFSADSDPALLLAAMGRQVTKEEVERIAPWRFASPTSPDIAARAEGRSIEFPAVVEFCRRHMDEKDGTLFIEGIGGVMVPLDEGHTLLDLMAELEAPVVLVAGSYLGTISHTLSALEVLRRRTLQVAALVIDESEGSIAPTAEIAGSISRFATGIEVVVLPRHTDDAAFVKLAAVLGL